MNSLRPSVLWRKDGGTSSTVHDMVNSHPFQVALTFALAEYCQEAAGKPDAGPRMLGAREFTDKLLNMGKEPVKRETPSFGLPVIEQP